MPIRDDMKPLYPDDWPEISARIRHERAGDRCECDGRCGIDHQEENLVLLGADERRCHYRNGDMIPGNVNQSRVVLTTAHLDHDPTNNADENLLAMCQRCHLWYDRAQHADTRVRTTDKKRGQERLDG